MEIKTETPEKLDLSIVKEEYSLDGYPVKYSPAINSKYFQIEEKFLVETAKEEYEKDCQDADLLKNSMNNLQDSQEKTSPAKPQSMSSKKNRKGSKRKELPAKDDSSEAERIKNFSKDPLNNHEKNLNINKCEICEKEFPETSVLKQHIQTFHLEINSKGTTKPRGKNLKCESCGKMFGIKKTLERHQEPCKCPTCGEISPCVSLSRKHLRKHRPRRLYPCPICEKILSNRTGLAYHKVKHLNSKDVSEGIQIAGKTRECAECGRIFVLKGHLKAHLLLKHFRGLMQKHPCGKCDKIFDTKLGYKLHQHVHTSDDPPVSCLICGKSFRRECYLKRHIQRRHLKTERSTSQICSKSYNTKSSILRKHKEKIQKPKAAKPSKPFCKSCGKCGKVFTAEVTFKWHEKHVHIETKDFKCSLCGKMFSCKSYLSHHVRIVHTNYKAHLCQICGKGFTLPRSLRNHVAANHNPENVKKEEKKGVPTKFDCAICGKEFAKKGQIKAHLLKKHFRQQENHVCEKCGRIFDNKESFMFHKRNLHNDKKDKMCSICGNMYSSKDYLMQHIRRTHKNKKGYPCLICGMIFMARAGLRSHRASTHSSRKKQNSKKKELLQIEPKEELPGIERKEKLAENEPKSLWKNDQNQKLPENQQKREIMGSMQKKLPINFDFLEL